MDGGQLISENANSRYVPRDVGKLSNVDPVALAERIANGTLQRELAAELGVTRQAIGWFVSQKIHPETWAQVRRESIVSRLESSVEDMEVAGDPLALARARESARLWMWRAEREHPDVWGAKQQIDMRVTTTDLGDRLRAAKERVVGTGTTSENAASSAQQLPTKQAIAQDLSSDSK